MTIFSSQSKLLFHMIKISSYDDISVKGPFGRMGRPMKNILGAPN